MLDRLLRRSDFLRAQKAGRKWVSGTLVLQVVDNALGRRRFGLTVTKKVSASAVIRNRIRRRLRALAYGTLPRYSKSGVDYVLIARDGANEKGVDIIEKDLVWCLKRLDLLTGDGRGHAS